MREKVRMNISSQEQCPPRSSPAVPAVPPSVLQLWAGVGTEPRKKEVELPRLPRKRDMKFYLYICIFVLQTERDLKSTADVIFQLICLCVVPGSPSLRNLGTAWTVGCGALGVTALCQLLLRTQQHRPAIPKNNVNSYLFPLKKKKKKSHPEVSWKVCVL